KVFQEGEKEGRSNTRQEIKNLSGSGILSDEYSFKISKQITFLSFIIGVGAFIYFILHRTNFFLTVLFAFAVFFAAMIALSLLIVALLKLAARRKRINNAG